MKYVILSILAFLSFAYQAFGQEPDPKITGDMNITFNTRTKRDGDNPQVGVSDSYALSINVANSAIFRGAILHRPFIGGMISDTQSQLITYSIDTDVVNPKNPAQTRNIGKFFGNVPVDSKNVYQFTNGNLKAAIFGVGSAKGFESKFSGNALGKPPAAGLFERAKKEAISITKSIKGKPSAISVTNYDKMEFQQVVLAAGPVQIYPEATVNGAMIYDYGRGAWHFHNVTVTYTVDGKQYRDAISGNIRWVESPLRKTNGEGEYQFDIRVNEPAATETSVFAEVADESSFFDTDTLNPSLTGTMKYKDTMSSGTVVSSNIKIDLTGNKLNKQQAMYLAKLLFFTATVPLNSE